ncbi:MAG: hypothetical protein HYS59_00010 [Candidatus Vogelbacteria bacterium]|nr:hypothetical protein [Candidatus Vogelbacteria bacterium]
MKNPSTIFAGGFFIFVLALLSAMGRLSLCSAAALGALALCRSALCSLALGR